MRYPALPNPTERTVMDYLDLFNEWRDDGRAALDTVPALELSAHLKRALAIAAPNAEQRQFAADLCDASEDRWAAVPEAL